MKKSVKLFFTFFFLAGNILCLELPHKPSNIFLDWLYKTASGSSVRPVFVRPWLSTVAGWYCDSFISRIHIPGFIQKHAIDMKEALCENPYHYRSFNDFFIRKLKPTARPIASGENVLTSPADGMLFFYENISAKTEILVKGQAFNLEEFLGSTVKAHEFYGGSVCIIYLAPWNYHRFHMPISGKPQVSRRISGLYESVHPCAYQAGVQALTTNERQIIDIISDSYHTMSLVAVGALCVGRISTTYWPYLPLSKGKELGYFSSGGSTIVLLFKPGSFKPNDITKEILKSKKPIDIKMGQAIGYMH